LSFRKSEYQKKVLIQFVIDDSSEEGYARVNRDRKKEKELA